MTVAAPLDPFRAWRRIVESAGPARRHCAPQHRPEPGPEARALVSTILAREHVYRPIAAADWPRAELVARSAAFLHLVEALVHANPRPGGSAQPLAEQVLEKLTAAGVAPEGEAVDWHAAAETRDRAVELLAAAAALLAELHGPERAREPLARALLEVGSAHEHMEPVAWIRYATSALASGGVLAELLRTGAQGLADTHPSLLVSDARRGRSARLPAWLRFGHRGGAADAGGRVRGALARELSAYLPPDAPGRLTTIAELLTAAGLPTTPATVRRLITRR